MVSKVQFHTRDCTFLCEANWLVETQYEFWKRDDYHWKDAFSHHSKEVPWDHGWAQRAVTVLQVLINHRCLSRLTLGIMKILPTHGISHQICSLDLVNKGKKNPMPPDFISFEVLSGDSNCRGFEDSQHLHHSGDLIFSSFNHRWAGQRWNEIRLMIWLTKNMSLSWSSCLGVLEHLIIWLWPAFSIQPPVDDIIYWIWSLILFDFFSNCGS